MLTGVELGLTHVQCSFGNLGGVPYDYIPLFTSPSNTRPTAGRFVCHEQQPWFVVSLAKWTHTHPHAGMFVRGVVTHASTRRNYFKCAFSTFVFKKGEEGTLPSVPSP